MAPGFGGTRDTSVLGYGEGFAGAGMHALLFDYRGFAASGGSPRQLVSVKRQRRDYHAAAARRLPGVDPECIVLWGSPTPAAMWSWSPARTSASRPRSP